MNEYINECPALKADCSFIFKLRIWRKCLIAKIMYSGRTQFLPQWPGNPVANASSTEYMSSVLLAQRQSKKGVWVDYSFFYHPLWGNPHIGYVYPEQVGSFSEVVWCKLTMKNESVWWNRQRKGRSMERCQINNIKTFHSFSTVINNYIFCSIRTFGG